MVVMVVVVFGGGEGLAGLAEGGESYEGACRWEPLAGLEEDIGSVSGLERKSQARHGDRFGSV